MLFWDVWGLTFMNTEINISDLEPTQTQRRQGKGGAGAFSYLLWLQSPQCLSPGWSTMVCPGWAPQVLKATQETLGVRWGPPVVLKRPARKETQCNLCTSKRRLAHQVSSRGEENLVVPRRCPVCKYGVLQQITALAPPSDCARTSLSWINPSRPSSAPGSVLEQLQPACGHTLCDCSFSWER